MPDCVKACRKQRRAPLRLFGNAKGRLDNGAACSKQVKGGQSEKRTWNQNLNELLTSTWR